jgi:tRNA dimethylallyltransferase
VGGTGLYLRSVVDDLEIPGRYPEVAASLEAELDAGGAETADLHARLAELDPVGAARMEPTNRRRVVRALEVTLGAGRPFSEFGPGLEAYPASGLPQVGLEVGAREIDRRIAERFSAMVEAGLVDEVRGLASRPQGISRTARQALGYREVLAHVEDGVPLDDCLEEAVRRTRQFARRQASWFRRDPRITWSADPADASEQLERALCVHG